MTIWDLYFATVVGWSLHPGYQREGTEPIDIHEAAWIAAQMMKEREKWVGDNYSEHSEEQESAPQDKNPQTSKTSKSPANKWPSKNECQILPFNEEWPI